MSTVPHPGFYVYILARPNGKPFYVGKGQRNRIYVHESEARTDCPCHKCRVIRKIWRNGGEVQRYKVLTTHDETEAYAYEVQLIALIGRESLVNLCDGGQGGGNFTEAALADIGKASRARWQDPAYRAARLDEIRSRWQDPVYRDKMYAARNDPGLRQRVSAKNKEKWNDPDYRARVTANIKAVKSSADFHEKASAAAHKRWDNPDRRANMSAKAKERQSDPERRAAIAEKVKAQWQVPGYREQISAKVKATKERLRKERESTNEQG